MQDRIDQVIQKFKGRCDHLEIRVEESQRTEIAIRGPRVDLLRESLELGGCVRAVHRGGVGFASFNRLEEMEQQTRQVIEQARLVGREETVLAPVPVVQEDIRVQFVSDPREVPLERKLEILRGYNDLILGYHPRILTSSIRYRDSFSIHWFGNSEGTRIRQERMDLGCNLASRAADADGSQMSHAGVGSSVSFDVLLGQEEKIREACQLSVDLLEAPTVKAGRYTAVIDQKLAGTFVHEAFGHSSEAEKVYENPDLLEQMRLGAPFGSPVLNIYDTGLTVGSRGFLAFDDEGVACGHTDLIRDGILVGRLHSRETAGKLGEEATGNARALDYRFSPMPRMRNTCIGPGDASFQDMIADIDLGVYAVDAMGGQSEEMFTFTAGYGVMIRQGRLAELVKNVTLSGNLFTTLKQIDMVGSDFLQLEGGGGCGKGDGRTFQYPLPVASGAPHVRIRDVVVGGQ